MKVDEQKKKIVMIIILVIITVFVVVSSVIFKKKEHSEEPSINIVTNYSNFYTVNSCLYRVITYLSFKNKEDMLFVVDDNYKNNNNINLDNVLDIFPNIPENSTFSSKKMYYQNINDNITKYYVSGFIEEFFLEGLNTNDLNKQQIYFIVYLDKNNKTFSVEPYSGDIFLGGELNGK